MYDPLEAYISLKELEAICVECRNKNIPICIIGGWAAHFYINERYRMAFGRDYMSSRDIDIFFDPHKEAEFAKVVFNLGFVKDGLPFRYEKIYHRELKRFISIEESKKEHIFNLIKIFLDLFSNKNTTKISSWNDLEPLKSITFYNVNNYPLADINTLTELKSIALFERDKADKETKDACDLYSLLQYSGRKIGSTQYLKEAIKKMINRPDLLNSIAHHVLNDIGKRSIVIVALEHNLKNIEELGYSKVQK